jgi:hypothetical protein
MTSIQGQISWLPGLLQSSEDGSGLTGVLYNASGLVITYQKLDGPVVTKTLTAEDWVEGIDGSYSIKFSAAELDTLGLFSYWMEYPTSTTYPGAVTVIVPIPTDVATETALDAVKTVVDALPTDVASSGSVAAVKAVVDALPTDVATGTALSSVGNTVNDIKTAVDALPTEVTVNPTPVNVNAGAGFSMNATQRQITWLPVRLTKSADNTGLTGITFDSITVTYQKSGGAITTKIIAVTDWSEGTDGSYSIRFTSDELDTRGLFQYWVAQAAAPTYAGVAQVTEANSGPGFTERTARILINNQPIEGAEVWITTDAAGLDIIAGVKRTNVLGIVAFNLDAGTYWIWWRKARVLQDNKQAWTVA